MTLVKARTVYLLPRGFSIAAYNLLLSSADILRYYFNSILYAALGTIMMLTVTCMTAYPLACNKLPGRRAVSLIFIITLFISGGLIPYFIWMRYIGLIDNIWAMSVPYALSVWNIIIFKTFFQQLPADLIESAYIDGANDLVILAKIIVPLSKPVLATFSVFSIVGIWNDFFTPMVFIKDIKLQPMQTFLRSLLINLDMTLLATSLGGGGGAIFGEFIDGRTVRAAAVVITILPIAIIYPFFQKYFAKGAMIGSLKA
jgi:putative aldouronate transport system permease protein